jgi:hypothetical protein
LTRSVIDTLSRKNVLYEDNTVQRINISFEDTSNFVCERHTTIRVGISYPYIYVACRSQWLRVLRHELSSPARTLGSWVRAPLQAWMFVCVYSVFVLSCEHVMVFRRADPLSKESYRLCKRSRN